MPNNRQYLTIGRRVQFRDLPNGYCRVFHLKFGRIETVNQYSADVVFDELIRGKKSHYCDLGYLHPLFTPEEEIQVKDQIAREQHADKYL